MQGNGAELKPVWVLEQKDGKPVFVRLLDMDDPPQLENDDFKQGRPTGFYRRDDLSSTAYFYLDRPVNNLPDLAPLDE